MPDLSEVREFELADVRLVQLPGLPSFILYSIPPPLIKYKVSLYRAILKITWLPEPQPDGIATDVQRLFA
jgi:hypothetical protein